MARRRPTIPRARQPNAVRLAYATALLSYVKSAHELVEKELFPLLPGLVEGAAQVHDAETPRNYVELLNRKIGEVAARFFEQFPQEKMRRLALSMGRRASEFQKAELTRQVQAAMGKSIAIDVFAERGMTQRIEAFASANASLIKTIPAQYFEQVAQRTVTALRKGERAEDLEAEIVDRYGVSQSRARLIARDQIGKLVGEVARARQENLGIDKFTWTTSHDERVRDEHVALDGQVFEWRNPPEDGIPGEPINCRCTGEPVFDELLAESEVAPDLVPRAPRKSKTSPPPSAPTFRQGPEFAKDYSHLGSAAEPTSEGRASLESGLDVKAGEIADSKLWPPELDHLRAPLKSETAANKAKTLRELLDADAGSKAAPGSFDEKLFLQRKAQAHAIAAVHGHLSRVKAAGGGHYPTVRYSGPATGGQLATGVRDDFASFMARMFRPDPAVRSRLASGVDVDWIPSWRPQRGYFSPTQMRIGLVADQRTRSQFTLGHEFGHLLEEVSPAKATAALDFRDKRTIGERPQLLSVLTGVPGYGSEVTRPDGFIHPYIGKDYGVLGGTEVTSMGVEYLFHDAIELMAKDPEHFFFTLGQLGGVL